MCRPPGAPLAKLTKATARAGDRRAVGKPASGPVLDTARSGDAELGSLPESGAINKDAPSLFYSTSIAGARPEPHLTIDNNGGDSATIVQAAAAGHLKNDAYLAGDLDESRKPPAWDDDVCAGSLVADIGEKRHTHSNSSACL